MPITDDKGKDRKVPELVPGMAVVPGIGGGDGDGGPEAEAPDALVPGMAVPGIGGGGDGDGGPEAEAPEEQEAPEAPRPR